MGRGLGKTVDFSPLAIAASVAHFCELDARAKLVGQSPAFMNAVGSLPKLGKSDATVLITGETGTGKELIARAIHYQGTRANFPFVPVNCGSLPDALLEDELFGHERGAYTDARSRREGLIAFANHGTLFLDEIDSLSPKAQVAILRVLQDKRFRAVGSNQERQADVRIVAASNACLGARVKSAEFRSDLYYRLQILSVHLPALRDRKEDIVLLATHFLMKHAPADRVLSFSASACHVMREWNWPGNVRELENAVIRGCALCEENEISAAAMGLGEDITQNSTEAQRTSHSPVLTEFAPAKRQVIARVERDYLTQLMTAHRGNVSQAAQAAGKERRDLGKLLKKHQLDPTEFKSTGTE